MRELLLQFYLNVKCDNGETEQARIYPDQTKVNLYRILRGEEPSRGPVDLFILCLTCSVETEVVHGAMS